MLDKDPLQNQSTDAPKKFDDPDSRLFLYCIRASNDSPLEFLETLFNRIIATQGKAHLLDLMSLPESEEVFVSLEQKYGNPLAPFRPNTALALLKYGMPLDPRDLDLMHLAIEYGYFEISKQLISRSNNSAKFLRVMHFNIDICNLNVEPVTYLCNFSPLEQVVASLKLSFKQKKFLIDLLISQGVDFNRNIVIDQHDSKLNSYTVAHALNQKNLCDYLEEKGAYRLTLSDEGDLENEESLDTKNTRGSTLFRTKIELFLKKEKEYFLKIAAIQEECDLFLISPSSDGIFKKSDKTHLYVYKKEGKFFYRIDDSEHNLENELINGVLAGAKFDQPSENPAKCESKEICDAVLEERSKRGHTPQKTKTNQKIKINPLISSYHLGELNVNIKFNKACFFFEYIRKFFSEYIESSNYFEGISDPQLLSLCYTEEKSVKLFSDCVKIYLDKLESIYKELKLKYPDPQQQASANPNTQQAKTSKPAEEKSDQDYYVSRSEKPKTTQKNLVPGKPKNKKVNRKKQPKNKKPKATVDHASSSSTSNISSSSSNLTLGNIKAQANPKREIPKSSPLDSSDIFAFEKVRKKLLANPESEFAFFSRANSGVVGVDAEVLPSTTASVYPLQSTTSQSVDCIYPGADRLCSFVFSDSFKSHQVTFAHLIEVNQVSEMKNSTQFNCSFYYNLFQLVEFVLQIWDGHQVLSDLMQREMLSKMRECLKPDYVFALEGEALSSFHDCIQGFKSDFLSVLIQIQEAYLGKRQRLDFSVFQWNQHKEIERHHENKQRKLQQDQLEKNSTLDLTNGLGLFSGSRQTISDEYKKSIRVEIAPIFMQFELCHKQWKFYTPEQDKEKHELTQQMKYLIMAMACLASRIYKKTDAELLPLITCANDLRHVTEDARSNQIRDLNQDDAIFEQKAMQSSGLALSLQRLKERILPAMQQIQTPSPEKNRTPGKMNKSY